MGLYWVSFRLELAISFCQSVFWKQDMVAIKQLVKTTKINEKRNTMRIGKRWKSKNECHQKTYILCLNKIWSRFCNVHLSVRPFFEIDIRLKVDLLKKLNLSKETKFVKNIGFHLDSKLLYPTVSLSFESGTGLEGSKSWKRQKRENWKTMKIVKRVKCV